MVVRHERPHRRRAPHQPLRPSAERLPGDPFLQYVGAGWRHTTSVYGPLFTAVSAAFTDVAGGSALRARLAFQGLAALSVVTAAGADLARDRQLAGGGLRRSAPGDGRHDRQRRPQRRPRRTGRSRGGVAGRTPALVRGRCRARAGDPVQGVGRARSARHRRVDAAARPEGSRDHVARRVRRDRRRLRAVRRDGNQRRARRRRRATPGRRRGTSSGPSRIRPVGCLPSWCSGSSSSPRGGGAPHLDPVPRRPPPWRPISSAAHYVLPWYSAWALPTAALARRSFLGVLVADARRIPRRGVRARAAPRTPASPGWGRSPAPSCIVTCACGFLAAFVIRLVRSPATEDQPGCPDFHYGRSVITMGAVAEQTAPQPLEVVPGPETPASRSGTSTCPSRVTRSCAASRSPSEPGELHALMGPNGSGKSTLANTLLGNPAYR